MKTAGIIAEFNPFHNGHEYHIAQTKAVTGADYCVIVMSGNYVQRGTPAMIDKYTRTRMALEGGADLVLELPVPFAASSAQIFARSAVGLLDKLGCIDALSFGSESASIDLLSQIAAVLLDEPEEYRAYLQKALKNGLSYPSSVYQAVVHFLLSGLDQSASMIEKVVQICDQLRSPNNVLGIEYLKALRELESTIAPYALQRKGDAHNSLELSDELSSASAIRNWSEKTESIYGIRKFVPQSAFEQMQNAFHHIFPITEDDFSLQLGHVLTSDDDITRFADMTPELADRIKAHLNTPYTFRELAAELKSKNVTRARINRALMHAILNITKDDMVAYHAHGYCCYARILGFKKNSSELLHKIKQNTSIPIISKLADAARLLDTTGNQLLKQDILAAQLYNQTVYHKFGTRLPDEYRAEIVIL